MHDPRVLISDYLSGLFARAKPCRLWRNQSGATAVEFALVGAPFFAVLMAIIESAIVLLSGQVLQTATTNAARQVMTGQAQNAPWNAAQFKAYVCGGLTVMFDCGKLAIDVRSVPSSQGFDAIAPLTVTNSDGTLTNAYLYQPGSCGDDVIVTLIYQWPILAWGLGIGLVNSANHTNTLTASAAFRNEPC